MAHRVDRLAAGLHAIGIGRGDRICSIMFDCIEIVELLLGCMRLGAVFVPLSPYLKGDFLAYQLEEAAPKLLVADALGLAAAAGSIDKLSELNSIFAVGDIGAFTTSKPIYSIATAYANTGLQPEFAADDGALPAAILYTSGTTGMPKGCVLSQAYFLKVGAVISDHWQMTSNDLLMTSYPLFHGAGLTGSVMAALVAGASYNNVAAFHASTFMADAARVGATIVMGPGAVGQALLSQPRRDTDRANRLRLACWVPLPLTAQIAFTDRFGAAVWVESYGQTECMSVAMSRLDGPRNPNSTGLASPLVEVAIIDDFGDCLPSGVAGEIGVRPRTTGAMFGGYWRKPQATLEAIKNLWHRTGDFGLMDEDGFIHFLDRKKDAIRRRGENICSAQLEAAIMTHPKIRAAAVHALPSDMTEDEIKVCIILEPNEATTPSELFDFFRMTLPYYAVPRYVELMDEFPQTSSMKVRKEILRERGIGASWDFELLGLRIAREDRRGVESTIE
jgi:crotonobetaine/carnitine-CoA ligase